MANGGLNGASHKQQCGVVGGRQSELARSPTIAVLPCSRQIFLANEETVVDRGTCRADLFWWRSGRSDHCRIVGASCSTALLLSARLLRLLLWCSTALLPASTAANVAGTSCPISRANLNTSPALPRLSSSSSSPMAADRRPAQTCPLSSAASK
jgi:hypothetical protein